MANDSAENEHKKPLTAGERLAAAQAAKAARKAASRGREAEELEEKALAQAGVARDWMQENLRAILIGAGSVVLLAALVLGWRGYAHQQSASGGSELAAVLASTPVDVTSAADAEELAKAYRELSEAHPDATAAVWARLGEGKALYQLGDLARSRAAYEEALRSAQPEDELIRWQAIEGIAYSYEAQEQYEEATAKLEEMRAIGKEISPIAGYQQGRMLLGQGKGAEASVLFKAALAELNEADGTQLQFTRRQIEARLATIDRSEAPKQQFDAQQPEQPSRQQALQPAP